MDDCDNLTQMNRLRPATTGTTSMMCLENCLESMVKCHDRQRHKNERWEITLNRPEILVAVPVLNTNGENLRANNYLDWRQIIMFIGATLIRRQFNPFSRIAWQNMHEASTYDTKAHLTTRLDFTGCAKYF